MSKLEELIQELCPDGVEYKRLGEICNISRGRVMSKDYIKNNIGQFPVYSSQTENNGELGKIATYDFDGEYLTWTTDGANAGSVFYRNGKFSITNVCGLIKVKNELVNTKYLYYALTIETHKYVNSGMGNPKLMSNVMLEVKVPVPPLEVQCEIVRILDKFTLLTAELTAELTARRKQYEYYKDVLFYIDDNIEKKTFEELCYLSAGGDINKENIKKERTEEYNIPVLSNGIGKNALYGYTNISKITAPCITISGRGTIGYSELRTEDFYPIVRLICVNPKTDVIDIEYLNHYIKTIKFKVPTTGIPQLTVPMIKKYKIPIPPIEKQKRIKMILNKFDKIITDIKEGLPAEIEARQKQYEYYRDKLLTFKEKK